MIELNSAIIKNARRHIIRFEQVTINEADIRRIHPFTLYNDNFLAITIDTGSSIGRTIEALISLYSELGEYQWFCRGEIVKVLLQIACVQFGLPYEEKLVVEVNKLCNLLDKLRCLNSSADMLYFPFVLVPELDLREVREALPKLQAILSFLSAGSSMVTKELEQLERYYPNSHDGKRYKWEVRKQLEKIETLIK